MSGVNHIAGGVVFTGIYLSMADVNIFSSATFLFFTAFFSLLPDIDHTSSIIGKPFYPISKYLDLKFGHRTITHSLLCYIVLIIAVKAFELIITGGNIITHIFIWAYASHLILDMLTIKGIPLFYPFKKNPCVIPGNPKFRFRASDFKTEGLMFGFFVLLTFSLQDLFANGFWNTYNRQWNSIKALNTESSIYGKQIKVHYDYEAKGNRYKGYADLITADLDKALIFDKGFILLDGDKKINQLTPIRNGKTIVFHQMFFNAISLDSLHEILKDKPIVTMSLRSNLPIDFTIENKPQSALSADFKNVFNPVIKGNSIDSVDINIQKEIIVAEEEMNILKLQINDQSKTELIFQQEKAQASENLNNLQVDIKSEDLATRERATKELPGAKVKLQEYQNHISKDYNTLRIAEEKLRFLKSKEHIIKLQTISGFLEYFTIQ